MEFNYIQLLLMVVVLLSRSNDSSPVPETPEPSNETKPSTTRQSKSVLSDDDGDDFIIAPKQQPALHPKHVHLIPVQTAPQMMVPYSNPVQYVAVQGPHYPMDFRNLNNDDDSIQYVPVAMVPQSDAESLRVIPLGDVSPPPQEHPLERGETLVTANTMTFRPVFSIRRTTGERRRVYGGYYGGYSRYPVQRHPLYGGEDGFPTVA